MQWYRTSTQIRFIGSLKVNLQMQRCPYLYANVDMCQQTLAFSLESFVGRQNVHIKCKDYVIFSKLQVSDSSEVVNLHWLQA